MIAFTTADQRAARAAACECPRCGKQFDASLDRDEEWDDVTTSNEVATERAADCCLFIDFDHSARKRIARRVTGGSTWLDAIAFERQGAPHD